MKLKEEIIEGLEKFPMTTHGASRYVNCHYNTAENRLKELEADSIIEQQDGKWRLADICQN